MSCNEWKKLTIDDICTVTDCQHKTAPVVDYITEYKMLRTSNIRNGKIDRVNVKYVNKDIYDKWSARGYLEIDDVILTREAPMGEVGIIKTKDKFFLGQRMLQLKAKKALISPDFLYYSLLSPLIQNQIRINEGMGSVVSNIRIPLLKKMNINIPNLEEQKKITDILSCIDEKIELNNEMNKTLEEMAQSIFKRWFVDFEFPNEDGEPYKSSGGEMVDSELGMIPKGWEVDNLGSLIKIQNGYAFKSKDLKDEGDCRVIKIKNINDLKVDINNTQYIEVDLSKKIDKKYHLKSNDIIIAMTGAEVGKIGILPQTENILYLNQRVGKFVENKLGGKYYALCMLSSTDGQSLLKNKAMGSAQPNISSSAIEEFRIVLPKEDILNQFYKITNTMYEKISRNNGNNITLNILRDTILPKLMSGEIKVN